MFYYRKKLSYRKYYRHWKLIFKCFTKQLNYHEYYRHKRRALKYFTKQQNYREYYHFQMLYETTQLLWTILSAQENCFKIFHNTKELSIILSALGI